MLCLSDLFRATRRTPSRRRVNDGASTREFARGARAAATQGNRRRRAPPQWSSPLDRESAWNRWARESRDTSPQSHRHVVAAWPWRRQRAATAGNIAQL